MNIFCRALALVCCLFCAGSAAAAPPSAQAEAFSLRMDAPEGYIEVGSDEFPDYLWAVAAELKRRNMVFHRLFLLREELPFLRRGEIERLTSGVLLMEAGSESFVQADKPVCEPDEWTTFGLHPGKNLANVVIPLRAYDKIFLLNVYKKPETADDLKNLSALAAAYTQNGERRFPKAEMPVLHNNDDVFCVPLYAARRHTAMGRLNLAEELYKEVFGLFYDKVHGINEYALRALFELATLHAGQKEYDRAELLLTRGIEEAKKSAGPGNATIMWMELRLGLIYNATGAYAKAVPALESALERCRALGCGGAGRLEIEKQLLCAAVEVKSHEKASSLLQNTFIDQMEQNPPDMTHFFAYAAETHVGLGKRNTAIFLYKITLGSAELDARASPDQGTARDAIKARLIVLLDESPGRDAEARQIAAQTSSPAGPGVTPLNVANPLMTGAEIDLYDRFGKAAAALAAAGAAGDEAAKHKAREAFRAWFSELETALD